MQETSLQLLPKAREEGGCDFAQDTTIAAKVRSVVYAAIAEKEINQQRRRALKAIFVQDVISATLSHCVTKAVDNIKMGLRDHKKACIKA